MLQYNTMRFATDELSIGDKQGMLISKVPLDTTGQDFVDGFSVAGAQPTGSVVRILFKVDDKIFKFSGQNPVEVSGDVTIENILDNGNTIAELAAVTNIPAWVNKKIYPIIALTSPADAQVMPAAKIGVKVRTVTDVYEKVTETAEINLTGADNATPRIIDIDTVTQTSGRGVVNITARTFNGEFWSDYRAIQSVKDIDATAIQFKIRYTVTAINSDDVAAVEKIVVRHTLGTATVSGDNAEIFSVMSDYGHALQTCSVAVRHARLIDSRIGAYVNFTHPTKTRTFIPLGISTGAAQVLTLGVDGLKDTGIDQSSLKLFADGKPIVNFGYNTEVSEVNINVAAGQAVTASYEFNRDKELWREMTIDVDQQPYSDGTFLTRFTYSLPEEDLLGQTVSNIRLQLFRTSGHVNGEILGTATGVTQQFVLKHAAKAETLTVNADFSYDEDSQVVTLIAAKGTVLSADYDWVGESHVIKSFAAAWSPAI